MASVISRYSASVKACHDKGIVPAFVSPLLTKGTYIIKRNFNGRSRRLGGEYAQEDAYEACAIYNEIQAKED